MADGRHMVGPSPTTPFEQSVLVIGFPCSGEKHVKKVHLLFVSRFQLAIEQRGAAKRPRDGRDGNTAS